MERNHRQASAGHQKTREHRKALPQGPQFVVDRNPQSLEHAGGRVDSAAATDAQRPAHRVSQVQSPRKRFPFTAADNRTGHNRGPPLFAQFPEKAD